MTLRDWKIFWTVVLSALAIFLVAAVILFFIPGVRVHSNIVRANLEVPCYVYNQRTGQFEDNSVITWKAFYDQKDAWWWQWVEFSLEACPVPEEYAAGQSMWADENTVKCYSRASEVEIVTKPWGEYDHSVWTDQHCYEAYYDRKTGALCVQAVNADGQWLIALAGFDTQDEALEYLLTEKADLLEFTQFDPAPRIW